MAAFIDASGAQHQLEPKVEWYAAAADARLSLEQWINTQYPTNAEKHGSTYDQLLASEGLFLKPNREFGINSTSMASILDGRPNMQAGGLVKDSSFSSAALRTLFPSAILTAIEDKLVADLNVDADAFDKFVALDDTIVGDKFERPLLNYDKPTAARSQAIAQLAEPAAMLSITTASTSRTIPSLSLGMMISDQAKAATTLDLVALAMARQVAVERKLRAQEYVLAMLNGDTDVGMASLSSLGYTVAASALDSAATSGLTHLSWMKFLYRNSLYRKIDWVVTDLAGAIAIENRTGKPTTYYDDPKSPRIDSTVVVGNPSWNSKVNVFITSDTNWPAKTIMGFDSRFAIHRVSSSTIAYQAVENFVMRRAQALRVDFGQIAYRLYDNAFDTLTYA
jgi:hypothetical protein